MEVTVKVVDARNPAVPLPFVALKINNMPGVTDEKGEWKGDIIFPAKITVRSAAYQPLTLDVPTPVKEITVQLAGGYAF